MRTNKSTTRSQGAYPNRGAHGQKNYYLDQTAQQTRNNATRRNGRKATKRSPLISLSLVILAMLVLGFLFDAAINFHRIRPNVYIGEYKVGFKSKKKASGVLDEVFNKAYSREIAISYQDNTWTADAESLGIEYDTDLLVKTAYQVGREGSVFKKLGTRVASYFTKTQLELNPSFIAKTNSSYLKKIQTKTDKPAVEAQVSFADTSFVASSSAEGQLLDVTIFNAEASNRLLRGEATLEAPIKIDRPHISDQEALEAATFANKLIATNPKVKNGEAATTIGSGRYEKLISFTNSNLKDSVSFVGFDFKPQSAEGIYLVPSLSVSQLSSQVLSKLNPVVEKEPVPATFKVSGDTVSIVPEEAGRGHSAFELAKDMTKAGIKENQSFQLRIGQVWPERTTEIAKTYGINEQVSTYTLDFTNADEQSVVNIKLSADYLDGYLIAPGETFSFNGALGKRTFERGFVEAPAIVGGVLVDDLGGGICFTSSTIFNTVLLSGLPVTDRINHSFKLPSYPDGQDAAVSWGAPDFKFKNEGSTWLLLDSSYTDKDLTFSLYGTSAGYDVSLDIGEWQNRTDYSSKTITVDTLETGVKEVLQEGAQGGKITVKRTVKLGDKTIRVDDFRSYYKPRPEITGIGR